MGQSLRTVIEKYKKKKKEELLRDFVKVANLTNNEMYDEMNYMYDSFIRQFYAGYLTEVYIRHGEGDPGTGTGVNLYKGKNQIKRRGGASPSLIIEFTGEDMENYHRDSADTVLAQVMMGIRFPFSRNGGLSNPMTWHGVYRSSLLNKTYDTTMENAFNDIINNFDDTVAPVFWGHWIDSGWFKPKGV